MHKIQTYIFFSKNVRNLDTANISADHFQFSRKLVKGFFSILHLNIRSIKKILKILQVFLCSLDFIFSIICFSETWPDDFDNFTYELSNYTNTHKKRSNRKGGGVSVYVHNSLNFKTRLDLSINTDDVESVSLEIVSEKTRNTIVNVLCRSPNGRFEPFQKF